MSLNVTSETGMECPEKDTENESQTGLINAETLQVIQIVVNVALSGTVCLLGIVCNVINIVVFYIQGFSKTVNVSMFAIVISDLCSLITLQWVNINLNPLIEQADISYEPYGIHYVVGGWPHACFLHITIWITVYVTTERFVCVALPLKVKQIFTPLRTKVVISLIFLMMFLVLSPEYYTFYFEDTFIPAKNKTRLGLKVRTPNFEEMVFILFAVMGLVSFFTLIVLTTLLVIAMYRKLKWREVARVEKHTLMSRRDIRAMKMVAIVAGALILCAAPGMFLSLAVFVKPGFNTRGQDRNTAVGAWSFAFLAEAINSSVNIIFFYKMSSRYRHTLNELLLSRSTGCQWK